MNYRFRMLWEQFQGYDRHMQWMIMIAGTAFSTELTILLIVIALHPVGVGAVLAFLSAIAALLFGRGNNPPPEQAQTAYPSRW